MFKSQFDNKNEILPDLIGYLRRFEIRNFKSEKNSRQDSLKTSIPTFHF